MAISGSIGVEVLPVINKGKFQAELKRQIGSIQLKEVKVHLTPTIAFGEVRKAARVAARLFVDDFNRAVSGKLHIGKVKTGAVGGGSVQQARQSARDAVEAAEEEIKKQPLSISISVDERALEDIEAEIRQKVGELVDVAEALDLEPSISASLRIDPTVPASLDKARSALEALRRVASASGLELKRLSTRIVETRKEAAKKVQTTTTRATLGSIDPDQLAALFRAQAAAAKQSGAGAAARVVLNVDADTENLEEKVKEAFDNIKQIAEESGVAVTGTFVETFKRAGVEMDNSLAARIKRFKDRIDAALGSVGLNLRNVAIIIGAGLSGDIIVAGLRFAIQLTKDLFNAALQYNEAISSTKAIFGEAAQSVVDFSEDSKRSLFATRREALETANEFGIIFQRLGEDKTVGALSTAFAQLAQDISALSGGDVTVQRVANILKEGLKGDLEDLGKIGIAIDDTDVKLDALQNGFVGVNSGLTAQSKLAITAALTLEQMSDRLGEAATRTNTAAGNVAEFRRNLQTMKEEIGTAAAIPITAFIRGITRMIQFLRPATEFLAKLGDKASQLAPKIQSDRAELDALAQTIRNNAKALDQVTESLNQLLDPEFLVNLKDAEIAANQAVLALKDSELNLRDAHIAVKSAAVDEARAQISLEQAHLGVQDASIALQQAEIGLRRESLASIKATNQLADSQQDLAIILDPAHREVALTAANLALVDAQHNVIDQVDRERDAFIALRRAQLSQFDTLEDIIRRRRRGVFRARDVLELSLLEAEANKQVVDSLKAVERLPLDRQKADLSLRQAELALQQTKIDLDREERDSRLAIIDSQLAVDEAAIRSTDGRSVAELALAGAKLAVKSASLEVISAELAIQSQAIEGERVQLALKRAHLEVESAMLAVVRTSVEYQRMLALVEGKTLTSQQMTKLFRDTLGGVAGLISSPEMQAALGSMISFHDNNNTRMQASIVLLEKEKERLTELGKQAQIEHDKAKDRLEESDSFFASFRNALFPFLGAPGLVESAGELSADPSGALNILKSLIAPLQTFLTIVNKIPGFAGGGSFGKNQLIRVGEHGAEWIHTGNNEGKVINSRQTDQLPSGQTNNITIVEAQRSNDAMAFAVAARLGRRVFN